MKTDDLQRKLPPESESADEPKFADDDDLPEDYELEEFECYMTEPATLADLEEICEIDELMAVTPGRREMVERAIRSDTCKIVSDSKQVLAYMIFDYSHQKQGCVRLVHVAESYRRQGVGLDILEGMESTCGKPRIYASVHKTNLVAQRLFQRAGYRKTKEWDGEGMIVYMKKIWEPMPELDEDDSEPVTIQ